MQTDRVNFIVLKLVCGLATCLTSASLYAQRPAAAGVVRISDRPRSPRPQRRHLRPAPVVRGQQVQPTPEAAPVTEQYVEYSRSPHAMTGNPLTDLFRTVTMGRTTARSGFSLENTTGLLSPNYGVMSRFKRHGGGCSHGSCGGSSSCGSGGACQQASCGDCDSCGGDGCSKGKGSWAWKWNEKQNGKGCCGKCLSKICKGDHACKRRIFGYFMCDGCGGQGCPKCGQYHLLYAANPRYFDRRDGAVYAAQGYGVPMGVPLAPNVRHTYNYGWGIPSSRLTPVSTRAPF